jgi:hypothetical protein
MSPPKKGPKENYQYQRHVTILEAKVLRNWLDVGKHRKPSWDTLPDSTVVNLRLWIHEVFALAAWRKREEGEEVRVIDLTVRTHSITVALSSLQNINIRLYRRRT